MTREEYEMLRGEAQLIQQLVESDAWKHVRGLIEVEIGERERAVFTGGIKSLDKAFEIASAIAIVDALKNCVSFPTRRVSECEALLNEFETDNEDDDDVAE